MKSKRNSADDLKQMGQHPPLRLLKSPERGKDNVARKVRYISKKGRHFKLPF